MITLGFWIEMNHSDFFEGSHLARCRYACWLIISIIILFIQSGFMIEFTKNVIDDQIAIRKIDNQFESKGFNTTFFEYINSFIDQKNEDFVDFTKMDLAKSRHLLTDKTFMFLQIGGLMVVIGIYISGFLHEKIIIALIMTRNSFSCKKRCC